MHWIQWTASKASLYTSNVEGGCYFEMQMCVQLSYARTLHKKWRWLFSGGGGGGGCCDRGFQPEGHEEKGPLWMDMSEVCLKDLVMLP